MVKQKIRGGLWMLGLLLLAEGLWAQEPESFFSFQLLLRSEGGPVPFAALQWWPVNDPAAIGHATSDRDGFVRLSSQEPGRVVVTISRIGFKRFQDTVSISSLEVIDLEEDIFNLEEVTITGTRTPHPLSQSPVLTQLITGLEVERSGAVLVQDLLELEVPGIETGQHAGKSTLQMMGLAPQSTLVLVDGERVAGETGGSIDFSRVGVSDIERIEIVRGASSVLYGSSAMGGVVNVITRQPSEKFAGFAKVRVGQANQQNHTTGFLNGMDEGSLKEFYRNQDLPNLNGDLGLSYRGARFWGSTLLNVTRSDGYQLYDSRRQEKYYPEKDSVATAPLSQAPANVNGSASLMLDQKGGYSWGDQWFVSLKGNYYRQEAFDFTRDSKHELFRGYTLGGKVDYKSSGGGHLTLAHYRDAYNKFDVLEKKNENRIHYRQVFNHSKVLFTQRFPDRHTFFAGIERFNESLESSRFKTDTLMRKSQNDVVLVVQDEYEVNEQFSIVGGLRMGWNSAHHLYLTPSVSVAWFKKPFSFRTSYARGFRAPGLKELYMDWNHLGMFTIIGNVDLEPEQNNYYSFSMDYLNTSQKLNVTAIASYNHLLDQIDEVWNEDQTILHYSNFDEVKVLAMEALLRWRFLKSFEFRAGYIHIDQLRQEQNMDFSPVSPHSVTSQLAGHFTRGKYRVVARLSGRYKGRKSFNVMEMEEYLEGLYFPVANGDYYRVRQEAYCLLHLTISQYFGSHVGFQAGVNNLLDYRSPIVTYNTSFTPGRRYHLSFEYRF